MEGGAVGTGPKQRTPLNVWGRLMRAAESSDFVKSLSDFVKSLSEFVKSLSEFVKSLR